tara:strand:+ start:767 stop:1621 length:855 start_codon:yes stop_codon:yes gene_type:complete
MYIKHSKFKNTGILFELLVRKITADTLEGKDSPAVGILKKYFVNTELGKEYKLYETVFKSSSLTEGKANAILSTVLESSRKLNRGSLKRQKYNIIRELKENYNIEDLFKTKINNYKAQASLYTLFEIYNTKEITNPNQIVDNKVTLLEHLTNKSQTRNEVKEDILEEFKSYDKDLRILTYRVLLEKFNDKYSNLNSSQKLVLKEFINNVDNTTRLKEFYNQKVNEIKNSLVKEIKNVKDKATKIKLEEIKKFIVEIDKRKNINNENLVDLLQYYSLLDELKQVK